MLLSLLYLIIFCVAISLADMGPTFEKDQDGNAIIDIPQKYWKNKTYGSLKIHLSKEVLQNLTGKILLVHICPYQLGNKFPKETILNIWRN